MVYVVRIPTDVSYGGAEMSTWIHLDGSFVTRAGGGTVEPLFRPMPEGSERAAILTHLGDLAGRWVLHGDLRDRAERDAERIARWFSRSVNGLPSVEGAHLTIDVSDGPRFQLAWNPVTRYVDLIRPRLYDKWTHMESKS